MEQQKQGMKKAAELERRFAKKDGAAPDGAVADGAASTDSDSDQDDEDKITETEEAGEIICTCSNFLLMLTCAEVQMYMSAKLACLCLQTMLISQARVSHALYGIRCHS